MRTLELFSGTGSVHQVAKKYGEVVSVDITNQFGFQPTHHIDIFKWDYKQYPSGYFDFIWASPPCATFSSMLYISKTKEQIKELMATIGLPLLRRALDIIMYFKPTYFCIENPDGGRMKNFLYDMPYKRASYCQYGYAYRKNTRFWTNIEQWNPKLCNCKGKHSVLIGGTRKSDLGNKALSKYINGSGGKLKLAEKYSIPQPLIEELFKSITCSYLYKKD